MKSLVHTEELCSSSVPRGITREQFPSSLSLVPLLVCLSVKADTRKGFCSRDAAGANLLRVYQRFHGYNSSSGAEFPPRKMLHDIKPVKYLGARSRAKLSKLEYAPWSMLQEQNSSCVEVFKVKGWIAVF